MRKLFLAICFNLACLGVVHSKVVEVIDKTAVPRIEAPAKQNISHNVTDREFMEFLNERIDSTIIQSKEQISQSLTDVQPSDQVNDVNMESQKSGFEEIYEEALKRLEREDNSRRLDLDNPSVATDTSTDNVTANNDDSNIPTLKIYLPQSQKPILVPAAEHIPYLMSDIEILPDGVVKFTETIIVVANGKKLRNGLTKVLPKYIYSRQGKRNIISYNLVSTTVNDQSINYHMREENSRVLLVPDQDYVLSPGVYTFKFEYIADNLLWDYKNFKELYWDVTGSAWNLVVSRVGAMLSIPGQAQPLSQEVLVGHPKRPTRNNTSIFSLSPQKWGYIASKTLFSSESLYLIVSLPSDVVANPSFGKKLVRYFEKAGDIYISFVCMIVIWGALVLSWKYIRLNKGQLKVPLKKTPIMLRYLLLNRYDLKSFGGFLLDMYRKNIIDIQQSGDTILLVKRTDNLRSLSRAEQKAINHLFTQGEPVLNVNKNNRLKIIRAARELEKELRKTLLAFVLKLNGGYIFFSFGMLFLGEMFISLLRADSFKTFTVLSVCSLVLISGVYIFSRKGWATWQKWMLRVLGLGVIAPALVVMSSVTSWFSIVCILLSIVIIKYYITLYADRNGLMCQYVDDAVGQKSILQKHRDNILLSKEIVTKQASIWVLDLEDEFIDVIKNERNKLEAMKCLIQNQLR